MTHAIVDNSDTATGATLDAALRVGRGADNDVVLDHPTVSRHHAVIERVGEGYFIRDLGSRNATRLNGRTVRQRRPLAAGDKVRFGQVRMTFSLVADADGTTPTLAHAQTNAIPAGIVFNCVCGVRLWAKDEAVTGVVTCRKCHAKLVVPAESTDVDSGETVAGLAFSAAPEALAAPVQNGTCSICQWATNTEDAITACPACGLTFHVECWGENCGCSAYGCAQVNTLEVAGRESDIVGRRSEVVGRKPPIGDRVAPPPPATCSPPSSKSLPLGHAMLAAGIVGGVLGLLAFGAMPLIVLVMSLAALLKRRRAKEKKLLLLAAGAAVIGIIAGVCVSSIVWLGWSPGGAGVTP